MCKYNHELCQYDLRGLSKYEVNLHYFEKVRNITREERKEHGWNSKHGIGVYKCRICGELRFVRNDNIGNRLQICKNGCNGCKHGFKPTVVGYNNVAITNPNLIKYFANIEDVYIYPSHYMEDIDMVCPCCGKERKLSIDKLTSRGFSCQFCSDGVSYPEKVMATILNMLNIKFKKQYRFDRYKFLYDFHLIDYNIIIEVHGEQHYYGHRHTNWKTYEEEHENDMLKYDVLVLHNYEYNKNFFIINAEYSNITWLRNSIEQCSFFKQFNLDSIEWGKVDEQAQNSLKIEICKRWNSNRELTVSILVEEFEISDYTIREYLKWGNENGVCSYNAEEERLLMYKRRSKFIYLLKPNGEKWFEEPMSQNELAKQSGISATTIKKLVSSNRPLMGNVRANYDLKYIGSRAVLADEYDKEHGSN